MAGDFGIDNNLKNKGMNFHNLVTAIQQVHKHLSAQAGKAVNISLTLRNWIIGWYIAEFELRGADRAEYGEKLLTELARELTEVNVSNCNRRQLYRYLQFYRTYPQIVGTLSPQLKPFLPESSETMEKVGTVSTQLVLTPENLINRFSYSHLEQLFSIDDPLKRAFYEIECIQSNWSVRELKRQIVSLYYERSGFSKNKAKLTEIVQQGAEIAEPNLAIRDPYIFEFLGIKSKEVMGESDL